MTLDMRAGTLPVAVIVAEVQSVAQGLYLDASVTSEGSGPIKIEGFLPVNPDFTGDQRAIEGYEEQELNLDITMESGSINWVQSFLDPEVVSGLQGMASAAISVAGTVEDPNLSGFLNVDKARFRLPELGVTYRLDRIRSTLSGVTMTLQEGHLRSGDGTMDITGTIDFASLDNSSFNLAATLDEFRTVQNNEIHTTLSGDINLSGRTTRPVLTGTLRTINTSYWVTEDVGGDLKPVSLTFEDEVMLAENFGYRPVIADTLADAMYRGLEMDLNLVLERDTWIRQRVNPEMAIELSGRLEIRKQRGQEDFEIFRSIEVNPDRSTIKQFGRKFRIAEGSVSFNGPLEEMMMNMSAEYEVQSRLNPGQPEVVITLTISGRLDDLELTLSSDPPLENTDIVSYIATGRPASESLQFSQNAMNNQRLVGIAASQLAGVVEGIAAEGLGLDVVDIQQDGLKGTRLTAGKYVSPRLFIGVSQPISFGGNTSSSLEQSRELTPRIQDLRNAPAPAPGRCFYIVHPDQLHWAVFVLRQRVSMAFEDRIPDTGIPSSLPLLPLLHMSTIRLWSARFSILMLPVLGRLACSPGLPPPPPNILVISLDDMNDWIGAMGGHPQAMTPNLDSFSESAVTFRRAYTVSPSCNPSRTAMFTGKAPWETGLYHNGQTWRHVVGDEQTMPEYFREAGYWVAGAGKIYHGNMPDFKGWDDYYPSLVNHMPEHWLPVLDEETGEKRFALTDNEIREDDPTGVEMTMTAFPGMYVAFDFAPLPVSTEETGDYSSVNWISEQFERDHEEAIFLGSRHLPATSSLVCTTRVL